MLEQGSILSDTQTYQTDSILFVPSAYCEFTKRWIDPETGSLFDSFIEPNANKIFESTDLRTLERALAIIKPDAIRRGLTNQVLSSIIDAGLDVINVKRTLLERSIVEKLYAVHKEKSFYDDLISFMTSGLVSLVEVRGIDCSKRLRKVVTNVRKASAMSTSENVIHGSDSVENGEFEVNLFFPSQQND
jgi:nucleoside-diphosphate kinase